MADFPALPLWTDAYFADTRHLGPQEHAAYLLLMMTAWRRPNCSLPDDDKFLAKTACMDMDQWLSVKDTVLDFWKLDKKTKTWAQKRLSKEREYLQEKRTKNRDAAAKRWKKTENDDADGYAKAMPKASQPTPTPTPTPTNKKKEPSAPKNGTRIPDDFRPDLEWSQSQGLSNSELKGEFDNFKDYWTSKSGKDGTKLDWQATWRMWIRNSLKRRGKAPGGNVKSDFRQHQETARKSFEDALKGTEYEQPTSDTEQPAFDLAPGDWRTERKVASGE